MGFRLPATVLLAVLVAAPAGAGAVTAAARPLRTLSFSVEVSVSELLATPGEGIQGTRPAVVVKGHVAGGRSNTSGSGERTRGATLKATGSIDVDVISATDDAGLIVDVAENALERMRPKVRIVLGPDGAVFYDPRNAANLTEEEIAVVRWLARGFYGDHPTEPGTVWTVDQSANGHVDLEHYRVVARDAHNVTLDYALEEKAPGATGYAATREGSLVYDIALIVPVKATFQSEARRQIGAAYETTRTSVTLALTADSFAKR
ncbi:MAG TPA: hypothetical protein VGU66_07860 [Candidatus Elarobacter sp.]|nr:hypothetical protein [Candidatus Elarobacter sp.]